MGRKQGQWLRGQRGSLSGFPGLEGLTDGSSMLLMLPVCYPSPLPGLPAADGQQPFVLRSCLSLDLPGLICRGL